MVIKNKKRSCSKIANKLLAHAISLIQIIVNKSSILELQDYDSRNETAFTSYFLY